MSGTERQQQSLVACPSAALPPHPPDARTCSQEARHHSEDGGGCPVSPTDQAEPTGHAMWHAMESRTVFCYIASFYMLM